MTAVLYSFRRCPYAMRARMALHVSGAQYEHREVVLRDKPAEMLSASPKGTVPVYITQDGTVIDESLAVMAWALAQNDPERWQRPDNAQQIDALIGTNDLAFKHSLDRYKYASRYDDTAKRGDVDLSHRAKCEDILSVYNSILSRQNYLIDARPSLADIAIFPFIRQFAATEPDWWANAPFQHVRGWLEGWLACDLFKTIMKKHPLFVSGQGS